MTHAYTAATDAALRDVMREVVPPLAPLAMPKQVLTRESGPFWRGVDALLSLLRPDLGRAG